MTDIMEKLFFFLRYKIQKKSVLWIWKYQWWWHSWAEFRICVDKYSIIYLEINFYFRQNVISENIPNYYSTELFYCVVSGYNTLLRFSVNDKFIYLYKKKRISTEKKTLTQFTWRWKFNYFVCIEHTFSFWYIWPID